MQVQTTSVKIFVFIETTLLFTTKRKVNSFVKIIILKIRKDNYSKKSEFKALLK